MPTAAVLHYHHESWSQIRRRYAREAIALQKIMPEVHVYWHDALRYFLAGVMGDAASAIAKKQFLRQWAGYPRVSRQPVFRGLAGKSPTPPALPTGKGAVFLSQVSHPFP